METVDLLVIGGGINGAGIACDAAGRGLSVVLCEKDDLAEHTSSASSKLIHGGLRYLEHGHFKLVREALLERETLMRKAPHLVRPLEFILPHDKHMRPAWLIRTGLFLYDHLAKRHFLPHSKKIAFKRTQNNPLKPNVKVGFQYADCQTDDARLVICNAKAARALGAIILTRTQCLSVKREGGAWQALLEKPNREKISVSAKSIVNAAGAWVTQVLADVAQQKSEAAISLVKGSHFTVPKFYTGEHAYLLQHHDNRVIFVIPYLDHFALIGTTDLAYSGELNSVDISPAEISYLLDVVNHYFAQTLSVKDINWTYSGVRALFDDQASHPSRVTREYRLVLGEGEDGQAPIISVFGGKITTYRILAEEVMDRLKPYFPQMRPAWTASAPLPGGDLQGQSLEKFSDEVKCTYPWLPAEARVRMVKSYGSQLFDILGDSRYLDQMGECIELGFYERELEYLIEQEWAQTPADVLWRRTKLGLFFQPAGYQSLERLMCNEMRYRRASTLR